ncbi:MAG TPA: phospholipase D-like domain-containing protein [Kofleriaceae bacterium]|nr:phospholipase D-like domain-containing protein [Kofleriaceae bacterium]
MLGRRAAPLMVETVLYYVAALAGGAFQLISACHALLNKRDPRAQLGWVVLCITLPMAGAVAYWFFGVNRIRTRAQKWKRRGRFRDLSAVRRGEEEEAGPLSLAELHPAQLDSLHQLLRLSQRVTHRPLISGNRVEPLFCGEQAYPAMIEAIDAATTHVHLSSYIFEADKAGMGFVDALGRAAARGVDVRVLVDAIGEKYGRPRVGRVLRRQHPDVKVAMFLPLALSLKSVRANLRNHRKILVVDGRVGFTGGMNIGLHHVVSDPDNTTPTADVHFRVRGPIVHALNETFIEDWYFQTGQEDWRMVDTVEPAGRALCRAIKDGPNEDFERLQWILIGAMTSARQSIRIMTPYFIPTRELLAAITSAVLHGVKVEIVLPVASNLPFVDWACRALLWEVLAYGAHVFWQPPPFNHAKLLIVDDFYVNLGSANLDPRSLRLNFELNLEVFEPELAEVLATYFDEIRDRSTRASMESLDKRSFGIRMRDATAKMFSPYL